MILKIFFRNRAKVGLSQFSDLPQVRRSARSIFGRIVPTNDRTTIVRSLVGTFGVGVHRYREVASALGVTSNFFYFCEDFFKKLFCSQLLTQFFSLDRFLKREYIRGRAFKIISNDFRGYRFTQNLPTRGQRTRTNSGTSKKGHPRVRLEK